MGRFLVIPGINKVADPGISQTIDGAKRTELINFLKGIRTQEPAWVDIRGIQTEYNEWVRKTEKKLSANYNPELLGFQSRLASHTLKLAVLLCVSDSVKPQKTYLVSNEHLHKATILGKWLITQATYLAETGFVKSKTEALIQKLLGLSNQNGGVKRSDAMQMLHVNKRDFDMIVTTAVERGEIRVEKEVGGTKPALWYKGVPRKEIEF
jgi:hypothetical protein